jgi:hypothetical protein
MNSYFGTSIACKPVRVQQRIISPEEEARMGHERRVRFAGGRVSINTWQRDRAKMAPAIQ